MAKPEVAAQLDRIVPHELSHEGMVRGRRRPAASLTAHTPPPRPQYFYNYFSHVRGIQDELMVAAQRE